MRIRDDHTAHEKSQIALGAGLSGIVATRVLLYLGRTELTDLLAVGVGLIAAAIFCYGVAQLAISKGRHWAWGFAGFFGYLALRFLLPSKPQSSPAVPAPNSQPPMGWGVTQATPAPPPPPPPPPTNP